MVKIMKNIKILDCTLRDGGRIINCMFKNDEIESISQKLANAKIDIIEMGFLRDRSIVNYEGNSTFFNDIVQVERFIIQNKRNTSYSVFVDYNMYNINNLPLYTGGAVDSIRFGFTRKNFIDSSGDILNLTKKIVEKGYKLFVQAVNILSYSDSEILKLVEMANMVKPYAFGIVDTYGSMYLDDISWIYSLVTHNLDKNIGIDFHSHNNYQLSFALSQEVIKLSQGSRNIIIDCTLNGMGKCAGNLNTELLVDYLVRKLNYDYEFDNILDIIDEHLYDIYKEHMWGYSIPALLAGIYQAHPNNIIYLTEKFRLDTKDIHYIISMIDKQTRQIYDYNNIEKMYIEYNADKIDDHSVTQLLENNFSGKEIVVLVPGKSLVLYKERINSYIKNHNVVLVSVNFISEYEGSYAFFGNQKKYNKYKNEMEKANIIISSNIKNHNVTDFVVNYHSLINRGYKYFENSTIMLLQLLKKLNVIEIGIAGFDGFNENQSNFYDNSKENMRMSNDYENINNELRRMLIQYEKAIHEKCKITFITPSIFENILSA